MNYGIKLDIKTIMLLKPIILLTLYSFIIINNKFLNVQGEQFNHLYGSYIQLSWALSMLLSVILTLIIITITDELFSKEK